MVATQMMYASYSDITDQLAASLADGPLHGFVSMSQLKLLFESRSSGVDRFLSAVCEGACARFSAAHRANAGV